MTKQDLLDRLEELRDQKKAVILAHNYQMDEVQDVADYCGDSFDLSRFALNSPAEVIVFCGVHFMAESAAILSPHKTVLLPEKAAGCPLADMVTPEGLRDLIKIHPRAGVAAYINSSAEIKAMSDVCVTSANAVEVVDSLEQEEVIFVPDRNLAHFVAAKTDKTIIPWPGYCITHYRVAVDDVRRARETHPDGVIIVHPECRPEVVELADQALGTGGMISFARQTDREKIIVGTEMGMIHRLKKECPGKQFYLLSQGLICPNMKYTTLEKVVRSLERMEHRITVQPEIREKAGRALQRMLSVPSASLKSGS